MEWYSSGWRGRFAKSLDRLYRCGSSNLPHSATRTDLVRDPFFYFYRKKKRRCEITIISFSRSICRGGLAALIGVTGKPYPSCLSCHSHPIRPFRAPSPRGEGCDTRIPSSKKRRQSRHESPEPWTKWKQSKKGLWRNEDLFLHSSFGIPWFSGRVKNPPVQVLSSSVP